MHNLKAPVGAVGSLVFDVPVCPYCTSQDVVRKGAHRGNHYRRCNGCGGTFKVKKIVLYMSIRLGG